MYLRLTTFTKTLPKRHFTYLCLLFLFFSGAPPMTVLTAGALTASNVWTTDAWQGAPQTKILASLVISYLSFISLLCISFPPARFLRWISFLHPHRDKPSGDDILLGAYPLEDIAAQMSIWNRCMSLFCLLLPSYRIYQFSCLSPIFVLAFLWFFSLLPFFAFLSSQNHCVKWSKYLSFWHLTKLYSQFVGRS